MGRFFIITALKSPKKVSGVKPLGWWLPPKVKALPVNIWVSGRLLQYRVNISLPPLKWHSANDSSLTGINLLLSLVVPDDLANHLISDAHKIFCSPLSIRSM